MSGKRIISDQLTRLMIQSHAAELAMGKVVHEAIEEAQKTGRVVMQFHDELRIIPREELELTADQVEANWLASRREMPERFGWDLGAPGADVTAFAKLVFGKYGVYEVESVRFRDRMTGNRAERRKASHKARHPHKREREAPRKTPEIRAWKRSADDE